MFDIFAVAVWLRSRSAKVRSDWHCIARAGRCEMLAHRMRSSLSLNATVLIEVGSKDSCRRWRGADVDDDLNSVCRRHRSHCRGRHSM